MQGAALEDHEAQPWVGFQHPVDVDALSLSDYHRIIEHLMDLGTIKSKLSESRYKTAREFAKDVRLTFHNAMTYNPKGQDVHVMAQELLQLFEQWAVIEADLAYFHYPPIEIKKTLEWSKSTVDLK